LPYFSVYPFTWGWATWRNRWESYDRELSSWDPLSFNSNPDLSNWECIGNFSDYWNEQIFSVKNGKQAWDIPWFFSAIMNSAFAISPSERLTGNVGFDQRASNTSGITKKAFLTLPKAKYRPILQRIPLELDFDLSAIQGRVAFEIDSKRLKKHFGKKIVLLLQQNSLLRTILPPWLKKIARKILY
jgi:hypothetical protein